MAALTVIDAHHHVWDLEVRDQPWLSGQEMAAIRRSFTVDDLRPAARAAGVGATVVVQTVTVAEETPELLALAAADPLVAGVVGWTDLTSPAVSDELARLAGGPGGGRLAASGTRCSRSRTPTGCAAPTSSAACAPSPRRAWPTTW